MAPAVSVVVPVFNELPGNLESLVARVEAVLAPISSFEIIFVDDGSGEETTEAVRNLAARHSFVNAALLSRNFGEQSAICAGLAHARGEVVINMDSDLQDPPELLPLMLAKWRAGFDVVYTQQQERTDPTIRLAIVNTFYWLLNKVSPVTISHAGEFRLLSRKVVNAVLDLPEKAIFLRHAIPWVGFRQCVIPFKREQRELGQSSYTFIRLLKLGVSGIVSSSTAPLVLVPAIALMLFLPAAFLLSLLAPLGINHEALSSLWALTLLTGISSLMFMLLVLGLYLQCLLIEVRARPRYIVSEWLHGLNESGDSSESKSRSFGQPTETQDRLLLS